ncbi:DNA-directed RNA polymerase subunit beta [Candidatus Sneabacter namystus]|uniref:DNA-directed RNA polymerase subunit beta n=1 Tax=Candidatus Sneabacter namystus TaxID=2601646 RepID=A0A5C0UJZ7_9RICK|nr:DNA-directed RNA polymerase subunit beta [Candidatus Sneabacter namystus]QEK39873.1 DNA-directed RNA polymerase subunit beta [Candidatus Sneabacter namystus]
MISHLRKKFGNSDSGLYCPDFNEVQLSYMSRFLQFDVDHDKRQNVGLQAVLSSMFPVTDKSNAVTLEFLSYRFEPSRYTVKECKRRGVTYYATLIVSLRARILDNTTDELKEKAVKEQDIVLCDLPLMTDAGTFIINGVEKVVVSQMHKSPGVFFDHDGVKSESVKNQKLQYSAKIIPYRGSWLDFEFDAKDLMYFRIDKRRKLPVTVLLSAIGMTEAEILSFYYMSIEYNLGDFGWYTKLDPKFVKASILKKDIVNADNGEVLLSAGERFTQRVASRFVSAGVKNILVDINELQEMYLGKDVLDDEGNVIASVGTILDNEMVSQLSESVKNITVLRIDEEYRGFIANTLATTRHLDQENALMEICKVLRPGEVVTTEAGKFLLDNLFFSPGRYNLSLVGRVKINSRLGLNIPENTLHLTHDDIKHTLRVFADVADGRGKVDDIDHLGVRRVRVPGELVENQFRLGLMRVIKAFSERISTLPDIESASLQDFLNSRLLSNAIKEFFNTSQMCQFMDQTNPLAEITHKRRLSALGPGGVNRERAGLEVRDVHTTHFGRICPVETPEGQNIGLVSSLTTFASVNCHGFIETPYYKVLNGKVTKEIVKLSAIEEEQYNIAHLDVARDSAGGILADVVVCKSGSDTVHVKKEDVHFVGLTSMQVVSLATSLIPFLENDDAHRALMGANMQRQAVPLLRAESPFVGTGVESVALRGAGTSVYAQEDGVVEKVCNNKVIVTPVSGMGVKTYQLRKLERSNHSTCINQIPIVAEGQKVVKGQMLAAGPSTEDGDLALGRNVLIAFACFKGYTFEDAVVISQRLIKDDVFTSVHIEEFEIVVRDTRFGPEDITRDVPNVGSEKLLHLDESGVVHVGTRVTAGDILVGKVTPKSESPVTPEEKLLRAIFGEKAYDVADSSLYVPSGVSGVVVDVRMFCRRGVQRDQRSLMFVREQIDKLQTNHDDEMSILEGFALQKLRGLLLNQEIKEWHGTKIDEKVCSAIVMDSIPASKWWGIVPKKEAVQDQIHDLKKWYDDLIKGLREKLEMEIERLHAGDELPQGALKVVKVFVATKSKLQPGDKMCGRHGNKGVVSCVVPEEDMPFLEDGTVVDIILNPLSIPSRMNVGQVLETHLGWASVNLGKKFSQLLSDNSPDRVSFIRKLIRDIYGSQMNEEVLSDADVVQMAERLQKGIYFATPVFDGAKAEDVKNMLALSGVSVTGKSRLIDGGTGEYIDLPVNVGYQYILKLHHLVDNKVHARSVGPYSLITQQPLGGKVHFGGQRLGEMECWALQAYGAAYTLQEMLTVKSDDVVGRAKAYEAIAKGDNTFQYGVPESFNVMVKELQSLCLNIQLEKAGVSDVQEEKKSLEEGGQDASSFEQESMSNIEHKEDKRSDC